MSPSVDQTAARNDKLPTVVAACRTYAGKSGHSYACATAVCYSRPRRFARGHVTDAVSRTEQSADRKVANHYQCARCQARNGIIELPGNTRYTQAVGIGPLSIRLPAVADDGIDNLI